MFLGHVSRLGLMENYSKGILQSAKGIHERWWRRASLYEAGVQSGRTIEGRWSVKERLEHGAWRLHPDVDGLIWSRYGTAEVDIFASETSTHCPLCHSRVERTSARPQEALAQAWSACPLCGSPPTPLIRMTLDTEQQGGHKLSGEPVVSTASAGSHGASQGDQTFSLSWTYMAADSGSFPAMCIGSRDSHPVIRTVLTTRAPSTSSLYANLWHMNSSSSK
ncbi:hypothetical protein EYF80_001951 [Liparis tanakae]|uniref:Uncharacterized protein n=1 Tax=Liparis tanakae TaxID=230148 RepID=A0A4Z2JDD8_9TELE|nr:hypothetical protein EYF80_001951 [Liparis tanakae]